MTAAPVTGTTPAGSNEQLRNLSPTLMQLTSAGVCRVKPGDDVKQVLNGTPLKDLSRAAHDLELGLLLGSFTHTDSMPLREHHRVGFRTAGGLPRLSDVECWSDSIKVYTFDTAPTDGWIASGTWDVTSRWSCTPDWSWFGGTSPHPGKGQYDGEAAIWCKHHFEGDLAVEYFVAPKMLEGPDGKVNRERTRDFNVVLCGNGTEVTSGYTFLVAPGGANEVRLLKHGAVVASSTNFVAPASGHGRWLCGRAQKEGNGLRLFFDGRLVLEHTDAAPLPGGYCGLWTQDNGIVVPKVTLYYERRSGPLLPVI